MNFLNNTNYLDQHFLIDDEIKKIFIKLANLSLKEEVVEIGPGNGTITKLIAPKVKKLTCIELDVRLKPYLEEIEKDFKNVEIIYNSVLNIYIPKCDKIVSSLPYSIIEPFIEKLIRCDFKEAIIVIGNKFASNVVNKKITKLSLLTNCFFNVEKNIEILPCSFYPEPRVLSAIIKLKPIKSADLLSDYKLFLFRELFFFRKSKIKNGLLEAIIRYKSLQGKKVTKQESKKIISELSIKSDILEKNIENCSNQEIKDIYESLEKIDLYI